MHPEADAFLDAIFDHPDEDTPRLVYADWLQEHDQENYAQFIRLQCAAAREPFWSDEANRLWEDIGRVWNRLSGEWWPMTRDYWIVPIGRSERLDAIHFERGFLRAGCAVTDDQFLRYVPEETCCWWLPGPRCSLLLMPPGVWKPLAGLPQLRRVGNIRLAAPYENENWDSEWLPDEITELLRSPHLSNVSTLDVSARWLTRDVVDALLTAPNLSSLERLEIRFSRSPIRGHRQGAALDPDEVMLQLKGRFKWVIRD
jgi:uncharacterized protein (TIGR02996 family)